MVGLSTRQPVIDERVRVYNGSSASLVRKLLAFSILGVMVFSTFAVLGPVFMKGDIAPEGSSPARQMAGEREVDYAISNMFEIYMKSTDYAELGHWNGTMGVNSYFYLRTAYSEYVLHDKYPFTYVYNPYAVFTTPEVNAGNSITTWYRMYVDANNMTEVGTDPGKDPAFVPILGNPSLPGGWVNFSWYSTYLTTAEMDEIRNDGTHYANTYYGVAQRTTPGPSFDDGYWHELQGKVSFNRSACEKFLDMGATGDLRAEWNTSGGTIEGLWFDDWLAEGSGIYDTYTAYDYSDDIRMVRITLDPDFYGTDNNTLHLRIWSMSWGNEVLLVRYCEKAGFYKYMQAWPDDWYLNGTIGPTMGDFDMRAVIGYHMSAGKDASFFSGGWTLETVHIDWNGNVAAHMGYTSPYNPYDPDQTDGVLHQTYLPGAVNYGVDTSYYVPPQEWDLQAGETITIALPTNDVICYKPYVGTSDTLNAAKLAEYSTNSYWGRMTMGNGWPNSGSTDLKNYYNEATGTVTLVGPIDFPRNVLSGFPSLLDTGSPTFFFDVAKANSYNVAISEAGPYYPGVDYTLVVTAKNGSDATVTDWNGTIDLSCTDSGAVFGLTAYKFNVSDAGVWSTTVRFSTAGSWSISVDDRYYTPDVDGLLNVTAIPEFGLLLIPVMGMAAMVLLMSARRRRRR